MLRAIYVFHRQVRGWNDIGYNFALDRFGRLFEARAGGIDEAVVGAHAGGYNTCSTGVAVLGTYNSRPISAGRRAALEQLLAWKLSLHGVGVLGHVVVTVDPAGAAYSRYPAGSEVTLPRIAGHRDADSTDCPGTPSTASCPRSGPAATRSPAPPRRPPSRPGREGCWARSRCSTAPRWRGQPLTLQARSVSRRGEIVAENPVAQMVTDAEGKWTLPVAPPPAPEAPAAGAFRRRRSLRGGGLRSDLCPPGAGRPGDTGDARDPAGG